VFTPPELEFSPKRSPNKELPNSKFTHSSMQKNWQEKSEQNRQIF
jgi:hypothetical protein